MDASVVTRNPPVKNVNSLQLEEALHEFANYDPDRDWAELIYLPPDLLEQISVDKLPVGVPIGIGNSRDGYVETYGKDFSSAMMINHLRQLYSIKFHHATGRKP